MSMTIATAAANLLHVPALIFIAIRKAIETSGAAAAAVCVKKKAAAAPEEYHSHGSNLVDIFNQYYLLLG